MRKSEYDDVGCVNRACLCFMHNFTARDVAIKTKKLIAKKEKEKVL